MKGQQVIGQPGSSRLWRKYLSECNSTATCWSLCHCPPRCCIQNAWRKQAGDSMRTSLLLTSSLLVERPQRYDEVLSCSNVTYIGCWQDRLGRQRVWLCGVGLHIYHTFKGNVIICIASTTLYSKPDKEARDLVKRP